MAASFRPLTAEDLEQAAYVESVAFYNEPTPERMEVLKIFPPDWTVGAFVEGRLVAVVRTTPMARRMNGHGIRYGTVGPVACLAEHRRKGYVGKLLRMTLERTREQGMPLVGLYTPHDALYRRYGWERAEGKKRYVFRAKEVTLRFSGAPGSMEAVPVDEWHRLDEVYRRYAAPRNGALHRPELWWRNAVYRDVFANRDRQAFLWSNERGEPEGFIVYLHRNVEQPGSAETELAVYDLVALSSDAYLDLWQHLLSHDLATRIYVNAPLGDPFPDLVSDPWQVEVQRAEGAMVRVLDVEHAFAMRSYCGDGVAALTLRVIDERAEWNDGVWRIETDGERMNAERTDAPPDIEVSVNFLAPLFTGFVRPETAAATGMMRVLREGAVQRAGQIFAVTDAPYSADFY